MASILYIRKPLKQIERKISVEWTEINISVLPQDADKAGDIAQMVVPYGIYIEEDGIWAFKPKPDRFLSFFTSGKKIIITNAFEKKCQKLPPAEKEKAEKCSNPYGT